MTVDLRGHQPRHGRRSCSPASSTTPARPADPSDDFEPALLSRRHGRRRPHRRRGGLAVHRDRHRARPAATSTSSTVEGIGGQRRGCQRHGCRGLLRRRPIELHIAKTVNGADADTSPLLVSVGTALTFAYAVWTTGTVALTIVGVTDDNGTTWHDRGRLRCRPGAGPGFNIGDTDRDGLLDPGEIWSYVSPADAGAARPVRRLDEHRPGRGACAARPPSSRRTPRGCAATTGIRIEKFVNGRMPTRRRARGSPIGIAGGLDLRRCTTRAASGSARWS